MSSNFTKEGKDLWAKATSGVVQQLVRERDKTFTRTSGTIAKRDDIVDDLVRASASGVGFFSEAAHYRRDKKGTAVPKDDKRPNRETEGPNSNRVHDAIWELDDAEQRFAAQDVADASDSKSPKDSGDLATAFLRRHPCNSGTDGIGRGQLALPVVLPQRRPKTRVRGFVRAYAPILAEAGVDQGTFLDFVETFNKSLVPNPYLYAINLAGFADLVAPDPALTAFGIVLGVAVEGIMEAQSRFKSNTFLDRVNKDFFSRHGLVCFVATWKPDTNEDEVAVGFEGNTATPDSDLAVPQSIADASNQKKSDKDQLKNLQEKFGRRMKAHDGTFGWSQPATLVFPALEKLYTSPGKADEKKKNALDRAEMWLDGYMDKRAQVGWMDGNPDHLVANSLPRPDFKSRYADPSHPAASGDLVALVTGGAWQYKRKGKASKKGSGVQNPAQSGGISKPDDTDEVKKETDNDGKNAEEIRAEEGSAERPRREPCIRQHDDERQKEERPDESATDDVDEKPYGPLTKAQAKAELKEKVKEEKRKDKTERKLKDVEAKELKKQQKRAKEEEKKIAEDKRQRDHMEEKTPTNIVKSLFQSDVLYLIIMNLPQKEMIIPDTEV